MNSQQMLDIAINQDKFLNITSFIEITKYNIDKFQLDITHIEELYKYSTENKCNIPHMMLEKYGVLKIKDKKTNTEKTTRVYELLEKQLKLSDNIDYIVSKTTINTPSGKKYKNEYLLSLDAFKLCLIRSQHTKEYAKHFLNIEKLFFLYYQYQCEYEKLQYKKEIEKLKNMEHIKKYSSQKAIERIENDLDNKNKLECVYFIKEGDDDIFKVGYTRNLIERLETLQVGNSRNLSVYKTIICNSASFYEKFIHHKIQKYHIKGEWYRLSKDFIDFLILDINN
jgi:hypothetical protein